MQKLTECIFNLHLFKKKIKKERNSKDTVILITSTITALKLVLKMFNNTHENKNYFMSTYKHTQSISVPPDRGEP